MGIDPDALLKWEHNVERTLWNRVDALKDDLTSNDHQAQLEAEAEIDQILSWLRPPSTRGQIREAKAARNRKFEEILTSQGYSAASIRKVTTRLSGIGIRGRGRPRTKGEHALRALQLSLVGKKTWREIVLEIKGSCRKRRCKSYCPKCRDVARSTPTARTDLRRLRPHCPRCHFLIRPVGRREQVCPKCADAMADLAGKLTSFLDARNLLPPSVPQE